MSPKKEQLLDQLFTYGNLYEDFVLSQNYTLTLIKHKYPTLSDEQFISVATALGGKGYLERVKGVYDQYFSEQELQEICSFWSSATGRKLVQGDFSRGIKEFHARWAVELDDTCRRLIEEVPYEVAKESTGESPSDDR